jgi:hypothetical protein
LGKEALFGFKLPNNDTLSTSRGTTSTSVFMIWLPNSTTSISYTWWFICPVFAAVTTPDAAVTTPDAAVTTPDAAVTTPDIGCLFTSQPTGQPNL